MESKFSSKMGYREKDVLVTMPFVRRTDLYKTERAYGADVLTDEIPSSNVKCHMVEDVPVSDFRSTINELEFDKNGFEVVNFKASLEGEEWFDQSKVESIYCQELGEFMKSFLGASAVQIFEAQVRKRHSTFPHSLIDKSVGHQPAMRPHVDASREHTIDKIRQMNGDSTADLLTHRWVYFNVWKPIRGPIRDWPLAICDPATVSESTDILEVYNITKGEHAENLGLHYNANQRWIYLNDHMPDELLVFKQADSEGNLGVPHASFDLPPALSKDSEPRQSVEIRMIAYFTD